MRSFSYVEIMMGNTHLLMQGCTRNVGVFFFKKKRTVIAYKYHQNSALWLGSRYAKAVPFEKCFDNTSIVLCIGYWIAVRHDKVELKLKLTLVFLGLLGYRCRLVY